MRWFFSELRCWLHNIFNSRPPATNFREGQRALMVKLMSGAGIFCGLLAVWLVFEIKDRSWPGVLREQQLELLGWALIGAFCGMLLVIVALTIGGPIGKTQAKVDTKLGSIDLNAQGDEDSSRSTE